MGKCPLATGENEGYKVIAIQKKTEYLAMGERLKGKHTMVGTISGYDKHFYNCVTKSTGHGCSRERGGRSGGHHGGIRKSMLQSMCWQYDCSLSSPYSTAPCLHEYATEQ